MSAKSREKRYTSDGAKKSRTIDSAFRQYWSLCKENSKENRCCPHLAPERRWEIAATDHGLRSLAVQCARDPMSLPVVKSFMGWTRLLSILFLARIADIGIPFPLIKSKWIKAFLPLKSPDHGQPSRMCCTGDCSGAAVQEKWPTISLPLWTAKKADPS